MRLARHVRRRQSPKRAKGRIVQFEPAVAAEDRDPLEQMVEGRALYLGQRVVGAFQRQPVADIVIDIRQTAKRVRRYGQLQGASVGQMHQFVPRLEQRGEQLASFALKGPEIRVFRGAARFVQAIQDLADRRFGREPGGVEPPQPGECRVEEFEPSVRSKDRDRGREALQHRGMGADVTAQLALRAFEIGAVEGKADGLAVGARHLVQFEQPALAADHDMKFERPRRGGRRRGRISATGGNEAAPFR